MSKAVYLLLFFCFLAVAADVIPDICYPRYGIARNIAGFAWALTDNIDKCVEYVYGSGDNRPRLNTKEECESTCFLIG